MSRRYNDWYWSLSEKEREKVDIANEISRMMADSSTDIEKNMEKMDYKQLMELEQASNDILNGPKKHKKEVQKGVQKGTKCKKVVVKEYEFYID